jgi:hypothetical protein
MNNSIPTEFNPTEERKNEKLKLNKIKVQWQFQQNS